ncbi:Hypothetical predicted protein [Paramuricea clavata]|uniref:Uncharacterized protein n=1 Tax=Paramuricea clavata TaxID=317549 RepID=A0A6S7GAC9_PARCT|nr:Hypothetical predicted protein [Paramuricea clavata]
MEIVERWFEKQHNQIQNWEKNYVRKYQKDIVSRITHVMDCEAYTLGKNQVYLREVSVYRIRDEKTFSFQIYMPNIYINPKVVHYQIHHVHGLPVVYEKNNEDFLQYHDVYKVLCEEFMTSADLVGYKGGTIERDLLKKLGTKGINIELLGCEKYANLITKYGMTPERCPYHLYGDYHCSRHEVQGQAAIEAFDILLKNYLHHPILWRLYSVNSTLRSRKPRMDKERVIYDYFVEKEPWLCGVGTGLNSIICYDDKFKDKDGNSTTEALISPRYSEGITYVIPCEWLKRVVFDKDGYMILKAFEFCCRQVLKRTDCKLVRCQEMILSEPYLKDATYFHVGCGPCNEEKAYLLYEIPIFLGLKPLFEILRTASFEVDILYIVYILGDIADLTLHMMKNDGSFKEYDSEYLQKLLKHILVCSKCCKYLKDFIMTIDKFLEASDPVPDYSDDCNVEVFLDDIIPCDVFLIDGEFNVIREQYYSALLNDTNELGIEASHSLVLKFIQEHGSVSQI